MTGTVQLPCGMFDGVVAECQENMSLAFKSNTHFPKYRKVRMQAVNHALPTGKQ
jgi:hypothetical protein